jgi:DNA-binding PadR family transcriptional regulator
MTPLRRAICEVMLRDPDEEHTTRQLASLVHNGDHEQVYYSVRSLVRDGMMDRRRGQRYSDPYTYRLTAEGVEWARERV